VVTTASLHDSLVDFSLPGIVCYRDRVISDPIARISTQLWTGHPENILLRLNR
jgi:hypothetical protein